MHIPLNIYRELYKNPHENRIFLLLPSADEGGFHPPFPLRSKLLFLRKIACFSKCIFLVLYILFCQRAKVSYINGNSSFLIFCIHTHHMEIYTFKCHTYSELHVSVTAVAPSGSRHMTRQCRSVPPDSKQKL